MPGPRPPRRGAPCSYRPSIGVPRDVGCRALVVYAATYFQFSSVPPRLTAAARSAGLRLGLRLSSPRQLGQQQHAAVDAVAARQGRRRRAAAVRLGEQQRRAGDGREARGEQRR
eukprot:scaffold96359_cov61-Phaeocystis_antarctica.AAC.1